MSEVVVFSPDEVFVPPNMNWLDMDRSNPDLSNLHREYLRVRYGALKSHNLDQIEFYFVHRFPASFYSTDLRKSWDEARPKIESLLASEKKLLGEFNGSGIARRFLIKSKKCVVFWLSKNICNSFCTNSPK